MRVAIIGSGPAGFYAAEALLKRADAIVDADMFVDVAAMLAVLGQR